tara:strand:- start:377 stop:814 length:438 start_codon:yes stop_codon:yes gene_type:complete
MDSDYIPIIYYVFTVSSFIIYYYNKYNNKYNSYQALDNDDFDSQLDNLEANIINSSKKNIMNDIELNIPLTQLSSSNKINININNDNIDNNNINNNNINIDNNNIDKNNIDNNNIDDNNKIDENLDINKYYNFDFIKKKTTTFFA